MVVSGPGHSTSETDGAFSPRLTAKSVSSHHTGCHIVHPSVGTGTFGDSFSNSPNQRPSIS